MEGSGSPAGIRVYPNFPREDSNPHKQIQSTNQVNVSNAQQGNLTLHIIEKTHFFVYPSVA
jgi:hypothetical protein